MLLRERSEPYRLRYQPLFEASIYALKERYPQIVDALEYIHWTLERTPHAETVPAPAFPERDIRLLVTPRSPRFPALRVLIEIEGPVVICWHASER